MNMLQDQVAVVTGGTGGLGGAIVATLLVAGASVIVPHRHPAELEALRARLGLTPAAALSGALLELSDEAAVQTFYAQVVADHGGLDLVVNTAGGFAGGQPVHAGGWAIWEGQLTVNLKTTVLSCAAATPHLIARGGGRIVNIASRTATQAGANVAAYAASKRAVLQLTEALAAELREHAITVNAILPSVIDTPGNRATMPNADPSRWVTPEAIARVVLFLVGPDAEAISGASLPVYGRA